MNEVKRGTLDCGAFQSIFLSRDLIRRRVIARLRRPDPSLLFLSCLRLYMRVLGRRLHDRCSYHQASMQLTAMQTESKRPLSLSSDTIANCDVYI